MHGEVAPLLKFPIKSLVARTWQMANSAETFATDVW
jgi:hypothetical protein